MWITNEDQCKALTLAAGSRGWEIDLWWRDEWQLGEVWRANGWPQEPRAGYGAVTCYEGVVAWLYVYGSGIWSIESIGPWDGGSVWRDWSDRPNGPDLITIFNARDKGGPPMRGPCVPDGWCGWADGKKIHLGQVATVNQAGNAVTVRIAKNSNPIPVAELSARRVFPLIDKEEAFRWYFENGETVFASYWAMKSKLWHKQQKLTGVKLVKHARPGPAPQMGPRAPTVPAAPAEPSTADKVAALLIERDKADAYAKECTEKRIACKEGTPEDLRWHEIEEDAWAKNEAAWDAWTAASDVWMAELLE